MHLSNEEKACLDGARGPALQWAMTFNAALGRFFDAAHMVPIESAHFAMDARLMGAPGRALLARLEAEGARVKVPATLDPCVVDFTREAEMIADYGLPRDVVEHDRSGIAACRRLGFLPTQSCITYQTVTPPRFGAHLAWGDTGAAIAANGMFGARTNFEGGPSALASALLGTTPAYGLHLPENRRGTISIRIDAEPTEIADWGAIAIWASQIATGYDTVPVFHGDFAPPSFAMVKQLGVALASHGSHAMFHLVGATPEAQTREAAFGGAVPRDVPVCGKAEIASVFEHYSLDQPEVDVVVFAAPQLAIDEVIDIVARMKGRKVHTNTKLLLAVDPQVRVKADNAGLTQDLQASGGEFLTGTCFYAEAPLMRAAKGWKTVVTNSAKLVNTLASAGYVTALRRIDDCLDAATSGRLRS